MFAIVSRASRWVPLNFRCCAKYSDKSSCDFSNQSEDDSDCCEPKKKRKRKCDDDCPPPKAERLDCGANKISGCKVMEDCCKIEKIVQEVPCCDLVNIKQSCGPPNPIARMKKIHTPIPYFSTTPLTVPPTVCDCDSGMSIDSRFRRLKLLQARYQVQDGKPIFLKNGAFDDFLFNVTIAGAALGLLLSFKLILDLSYFKHVDSKQIAVEPEPVPESE